MLAVDVQLENCHCIAFLFYLLAVGSEVDGGQDGVDEIGEGSGEGEEGHGNAVVFVIVDGLRGKVVYAHAPVDGQEHRKYTVERNFLEKYRQN